MASAASPQKPSGSLIDLENASSYRPDMVLPFFGRIRRARGRAPASPARAVGRGVSYNSSVFAKPQCVRVDAHANNAGAKSTGGGEPPLSCRREAGLVRESRAGARWRDVP